MTVAFEKKIDSARFGRQSLLMTNYSHATLRRFRRVRMKKWISLRICKALQWALVILKFSPGSFQGTQQTTSPPISYFQYLRLGFRCNHFQWGSTVQRPTESGQTKRFESEVTRTCLSGWFGRAFWCVPWPDFGCELSTCFGNTDKMC